MTFQRSRSSLLGQKPEIVSDLITTSEKVEKKKKKTLGKNPRESTFYFVPVCILKLLEGNFPRKCFRLDAEEQVKEFVVVRGAVS